MGFKDMVEKKKKQKNAGINGSNRNDEKNGNMNRFSNDNKSAPDHLNTGTNADTVDTDDQKTVVASVPATEESQKKEEELYGQVTLSEDITDEPIRGIVEVLTDEKPEQSITTDEKKANSPNSTIELSMSDPDVSYDDHTPEAVEFPGEEIKHLIDNIEDSTENESELQATAESDDELDISDPEPSEEEDDLDLDDLSLSDSYEKSEESHSDEEIDLQPEHSEEKRKPRSFYLKHNTTGDKTELVSGLRAVFHGSPAGGIMQFTVEDKKGNKIHNEPSLLLTKDQEISVKHSDVNLKLKFENDKPVAIATGGQTKKDVVKAGAKESAGKLKDVLQTYWLELCTEAVLLTSVISGFVNQHLRYNVGTAWEKVVLISSAVVGTAFVFFSGLDRKKETDANRDDDDVF